MYPEIPYQGISWPVTQHAGVISQSVFDGLLNACLLCNGKEIDAQRINAYLVDNGILTPNVRTDSNQIDAWRDYQQILSEFGLIYSARVSRVMRLTPVALAYLAGRLSYSELMTLQIMRYQYPNGHKSQLSQSLIESYGKKFTFDSYTEMQVANGIMFRPGVIVWQILQGLWKHGEQAILTIDEMQTYVVRCTTHSDVGKCVEYICNSRQEGHSLQPLLRARRNMADWMKILKQSPLFMLNSDGSAIALSGFSIRNKNAIQSVCDMLSDPGSFWQYEMGSFKEHWFDFYGDFDGNTELVIKMQ